MGRWAFGQPLKKFIQAQDINAAGCTRLERIECGAPIDSAQGETGSARNLAGRDPGAGPPRL